MLGECHMHMFMDGMDYKRAVQLHKNQVQDEDIHKKLKKYRDMGITFLRDGGDIYGVSKRAAQLAPEYGITYRTPVFAIHKNGHYGAIVGHGFDAWKEYHALVQQVKAEGGDFVKIMISGIMDFEGDGGVSEAPLLQDEIYEMIHIAKEEGFAVMAHANGARTVQAAAEAGVDSVEHGNFVDEESLQAMAEHHTIWVPTYVTIANPIGSGRFDDTVLKRLCRRQAEMLRKGFALGIQIAVGSDAGAYGVLHGQGVYNEYKILKELAAECIPEPDQRLLEAEAEIRRRFCRANV